MVEIRWTDEAVKWLKDIHDYIANDNPAAAKRVTAEIYNKTQLLVKFPEIGYQYKKTNVGVIRILLYGHYRIAYLIKSNSDSIDILGVFHGALKIEKYLF